MPCTNRRRSSVARRRRGCDARCSQIVREGGRHGRHRRGRTRTGRPAARSSPSSIATTMVEPERDTPGISARTWQAPITSAARPAVGRIAALRRRPQRSTISITTPPTMNATAITSRRPQSSLHVVSTAARRRPRRHRADDDERESCRGRASPTAPRAGRRPSRSIFAR